MTTEASPNGHDAVIGSGTNGKATSEQIVEPATTVAVSRSGSPPPADLSSAFQPATALSGPVHAMGANANGCHEAPIKADDEAKTRCLREEDNAEWRPRAP